MRSFFRFIAGIIRLQRRLAEDELRQKAEGYSISSAPSGPERWVSYREFEREINVVHEYNWTNDVVIYTDSLRKWSKPYNESVTDFDFQKILSRCVRYFSCWGGDVTLDDRLLPTNEDLKASLEKSGIPYEELPGGIIMYSTTFEDERKRQDTFSNRKQ
jgi:hypothetical protein